MSTPQEFQAQVASQAVPGFCDWGAIPLNNFVQGVKEVQGC